jgi:hypothetical protein
METVEAECAACGAVLKVGDVVYPGIGKVWCDAPGCSRMCPATVQSDGSMAWENDDGKIATFKIEV